MSPEETALVTALFDRVKAAAATPRDPQAQALIDRLVREQPAGPYYLAQAVIVQEKGLEAAAAHIGQLEERVRQLEAGNADPGNSRQGGFLGSIFGAGTPSAPSPAPAYRNDTPAQTSAPWGRPVVAPPQNNLAGQANPASQGGPWGMRSPFAPSMGGSFLQGALGTAAGVAGGMLLANSLSGLFSGGHMGALGLGSPFGNAPTGETVINETTVNNYGSDAQPAAADRNDDIQPADDNYASDDDFGNDDGGDDDGSYA